MRMAGGGGGWIALAASGLAKRALLVALLALVLSAGDLAATAEQPLNASADQQLLPSFPTISLVGYDQPVMPLRFIADDETPRATILPPTDMPAPPALNRAVPTPPAISREPTGDVEPPVLRSPLEVLREAETPDITFAGPELVIYPIEAPLGYTGRTGVLPTAGPETSDFIPLEDRWRSGFPAWDRYGHGHPAMEDYPYAEGHWYDPYRQNVFKGDYPIIGQHTFFKTTLESETVLETRQVPTPTTPFESTRRPGQVDFFGDPNQFAAVQNFRLSFELNHGDAAFKPTDWRVLITPQFNLNYLDVNELGIVSPDVRKGSTRYRTDFALQEWFLESKLADIGPNYDFVSARVGSQPFTSDFRGFIFSDVNRGVRLFGTNSANRDQFNVLWFDQAEKDTNSELNTFEDRGQDVVVLNYYRQDFIFPGYTTQFSLHINHDDPTLHYDDNGFLVRPDPAGIALPHEVETYYFGWAGDGHINRFNIDHALYYVCGQDSLSPLAQQPLLISAFMAAAEVSYDRDWVRFRSSVFYASGDKDPLDHKGQGFDTILDNPNFAGGEFSFWQHQKIGLLGVNLKQPGSLVADLRSSKTEGQSNFVNPGVFLANVGMDFDVTPKARLVTNCNFLWFDEVAPLQQFIFQKDIHRSIGTDLSLGVEYRPRLNNNLIVTAGISGLIPGDGFKDIYNPIAGSVDTMFASFMNILVQY